MDALSFLAKPPARPGPLYVLHGDELFLKRQVLGTLKRAALGPEGDDAAVSTHAGETAAFAQIMDELDTAPFFAARRVVIVDNADPFVTRYRALLEKKVQQLPATGLLVLDVKTWNATWRLSKLVEPAATIVCKTPAAAGMASWCMSWSSSRHGKKLQPAAAGLLVELIGPEMGLLDQEIEKLATYVGERSAIEAQDVDILVGQSRGENVFKILDALAAGQAGAALQMLDRLLDQGEEPMRLLGALGSQLRKLAQAARLVVQGNSMGTALARVGVPPFVSAGAEKQLRHIGRHRAAQLYDWLLQLNMELRGDSMLPPHVQFERLLVRLAPAASKPAASKPAGR